MAGQRFKVDNGILAGNSAANSYFGHNVQMSSNLTVNGDLLFVGGDLIVGGDQVITGQTLYATDLLPGAPTGIYISNTTYKFDAYLRNVDISGYLNPGANNISLGTASNRWQGFMTSLDVLNTSTFAGNSTFTANVAVSGQLTVSNKSNLGNTVVTGTLNVSSTTTVSGNLAVTGTSAFTGNVVSAANVSAKGLVLDYAALFSNGATVTLASNTIIDSYPKTSCYTSKITVSVNRANTALHMVEMLVINDGTNVLLTRYGEIFNTSLGTFDAAINNANVEIYFSPTTANTYTVRTLRQNLA
jgi:hypothetical protein